MSRKLGDETIEINGLAGVSLSLILIEDRAGQKEDRWTRLH